MKVHELFEAAQGSPGQDKKLKGGAYYKPQYKSDISQIRGSVLDWMDELGFTPEHIAVAVKEIKASTLFKKLEDAGLKYDSGAKQEKLGTLSFNAKRVWGGRGGYIVYANGQLRSKTGSSWSDAENTTPLKTPKPRVRAGDPIKSLNMIYTAALTEMLNKWEKYKKANAK